MNICYVVRFSRLAWIVSFDLLDGLHVRLCRPDLREAPAGFGLERLAPAFMKILASGMLSGFFCLFGLFGLSGLSRLIGLFGLSCLFG